MLKIKLGKVFCYSADTAQVIEVLRQYRFINWGFQKLIPIKNVFTKFLEFSFLFELRIFHSINKSLPILTKFGGSSEIYLVLRAVGNFVLITALILNTYSTLCRPAETFLEYLLPPELSEEAIRYYDGLWSSPTMKMMRDKWDDRGDRYLVTIFSKKRYFILQLLAIARSDADQICKCLEEMVQYSGKDFVFFTEEMKNPETKISACVQKSVRKLQENSGSESPNMIIYDVLIALLFLGFFRMTAFSLSIDFFSTAYLTNPLLMSMDIPQFYISDHGLMEDFDTDINLFDKDEDEDEYEDEDDSYFDDEKGISYLFSDVQDDIAEDLDFIFDDYTPCEILEDVYFSKKDKKSGKKEEEKEEEEEERNELIEDFDSDGLETFVGDYGPHMGLLLGTDPNFCCYLYESPNLAQAVELPGPLDVFDSFMDNELNCDSCFGISTIPEDLGIRKSESTLFLPARLSDNKCLDLYLSSNSGLLNEFNFIWSRLNELGEFDVFDFSKWLQLEELEELEELDNSNLIDIDSCQS